MSTPFSGPDFPSVDEQTGKIREFHIPDRLQPANLNDNIQDTAGGMVVAVPPISAVYNNTLNQLTISYDQSKSTYGAQCRLQRNGTQTFTAGTIQGVILNGLSFNDNNTVFSTDLTTGRITVLQAGSYLATWATRFSAAANGERYSSIGVNGISNTRSEAGGTRADQHTINGVAPIRLLANEYVNLCVFVSGASVDVQGGNSFHTWLSLVRLGA